MREEKPVPERAGLPPASGVTAGLTGRVVSPVTSRGGFGRAAASESAVSGGRTVNFWRMIARMSCSRIKISFSPSTTNSSPPYFENRTWSPTLTWRGLISPSAPRPVAHRDDNPPLRLLRRHRRDYDPPSRYRLGIVAP